jgi:putative redox protein
MSRGVACIGHDLYRTWIDLGSGHRLIADEPASLGGADSGPSPYEFLIASLGACTAITLRMYADRHGWRLGSVQVQLRLSREDEVLVVHRSLHIEGLDDVQKARLAEIAERTPVTRTLKWGLQIQTTLA